jgi:methylated-DNA-[protein]-cysteine S-methyltransferase
MSVLFCQDIPAMAPRPEHVTERSLELFSPLHVAVVETPLGKVWVESDGKLITRLSYGAVRGNQAKEPKVLLEACKQLEAYFARRHKAFKLPLQHAGTPFHKLVVRQVERIPFGSALSYQDVAKAVGGRALARAVGKANATNTLPIFIPCHRVLGSDGMLTGYVGGLWRKQWLLVHEGVLPRNLWDEA